MPIGTSDGEFFKNELEYQQNNARIYISPVSSRMPLEGSTEPAGALNSEEGSQVALDDRRDEPNPMAPEWKNVIPSLKDLLFKAFVGPPMADPVEPTDLSRQAGYDDIKNEKIVPQRSLLDRAFDDTSDGAQFFYNIARAIQGKEPAKLGMDTPLSEMEFSKGTKAGNRLFGLGGEERYQTWPEKAVRGAIEGIKKFSGQEPTWAMDPVTGEVRTDIQTIEKVTEAAGLAVMGPAPVARKLADGTLGSFAGVRSQAMTQPGSRTKFYAAQEMEFTGQHSDDIWLKTGWFKGADGQWRYEIPDRNAKLRLENLDYSKTIVDNPSGWSHVEPHGTVIENVGPKRLPEYQSGKNFDDWIEAKGEFASKNLGDILDHPELFQAYPELKDVKIDVVPENWRKDALAIFSRNTNTIHISEMPAETFKKVLMHEIQHWIQKHEGFAQGGNARMFRPPGLAKAEQGFRQAKDEFIANNPKALLEYEGVVQAETNGVLERLSPEMQAEIRKKIQKAKDEGVYNGVKNIVTAERLLEKAAEEYHDKYMRLMGEVESRNVEARMNFDKWDSRSMPPRMTEDTPRIKQIDPRDLR